MFHQTLALVIVTVALTGCATPDSSSQRTEVASVQAVYVEVVSDIYVSEHLMATAPAQNYWVKLPLPDDQGQNITTMARVPAQLVLAAGDTVSVALAPMPGHGDTITLKRPNRVLDVINTSTLAQANTPPLPAFIERLLLPASP